MPKLIKHREMLRRRRAFGWHGPYQRGKHPFMVKSDVRLTIGTMSNALQVLVRFFKKSRPCQTKNSKIKRNNAHLQKCSLA
jgi:hypothetical protein